MTTKKRVCVVAPCHNEGSLLAHFVQRVKALEPDLSQFDLDILLIDDGSTDDTGQVIARLAAEDTSIKGVILSRNFGHQRAIAAGLDYVDADYVVVMDADLQDPPELVPEMVAQLDAGYDVVHAARVDRSVDSVPKRVTAQLFYAFMRRWVLPELVENAADFKAFNRRALDALQRYREHVRFLRGLVATMGFRQTTVPFVRAARHSGFSKYHLKNVLRLARDAIVSNTALPLRLALYLGLSMWSVLPLYGAACLVTHYWGGGLATPGLHLLVVSMFALFALVFVFMGLIGEYLKVIILEVKDRPLYIVRECHNLTLRR